jgi:hypothetical protein
VTRATLKHPQLFAILVLLAVFGLATARFVLSGASFSSASSLAPHTLISAATDWVPPAVARSVVTKTVVNTPSGVAGYVRATGTYRIYAQVTDVTSAVASVTADVSSLTPSATAVPLVAGSYTVGLATYNYASAELTVAGSTGEGTTGYSIHTVDTAANAGTDNSPTVVVDNTAPTAALTDPGNPFRGRTEQFGATLGDSGGSGVDTAQVQVSPTGQGNWTTICTLSSSSSCTYNSTLLADGSYDLRSTVTDNAGNAATSPVLTNHQLDNQHPGVVLADAGPSLSHTVTLTATATSGAYTVKTVVISRAAQGSSTWKTICTVTLDTDTSAPYSCPFVTTTGTADGTYDLRAVATDQNGNTGTSAIVTDTVDNRPPSSVQMTNPGSALNGTVTLSGSAVDGGTLLANMTFQVAPGTTGSWATACTATSPATSCAFDTTTLTDGVYEFRMLATDQAGNSAASAARTGIRIDNTAPTVTMTDAGPFVRASITLASTTSDAGVGMASVRYQRSPAGMSTWTDVCTSSTAPYSCAFATTGVPDGLYDLRAIATDALGNTTTSATSPGHFVDNTVPASVTVTDPGLMRGTATVASSATDTGSGMATLSFQATPAGGSSWTTLCVVNGSASSCTYDTTAAPDGLYDIRVTATDNAGNTATSPTLASRRIDNTAPTATLTAPASPMQGTVAFSGTGSDGGSGVTSLKVQRSPTGQGAWTDVCSSATASLSCSYDTTTIPDGAYDFRMFATDAAGNTGASTVATNRMIDNTAPTVTLTDPGPWIHGTVTLGATAADAGTGLASVQIQRAAHGGASWTTICTDTASPYQCTLNTTTLTSGATYDFRAIATDKASPAHTTTTPVTAGSAVDNTAPTATLTAPATPMQGTVAFSGTGSDSGSGIASLTVQRSPTGQGSWTDVCSSATASLSCSYDTTTAADGAYDFRMLATDAAGNTGASTVATNRIIDNTGPIVTITDPGARIRGTVTLGASATDAGAGVASVQLQYAVQGTGTWSGCAAADTTSPYSCSLNTTTLTSGTTYDLRAIATDNAGHATTSAIVSSVVDNTAPTAADVQSANTTGGIQGKAESGDTLTYTASEQLDPATILAGWDGTATTVTVRVNKGATGAHDTVTMYNSTNKTQLALGSIDLGSLGYVSANARFTGSTMVQSGATITITLGTASSTTAFTTAAATAWLVWTPSTSAKDLAGNAMSTATATQSGAAKLQF